MSVYGGTAIEPSVVLIEKWIASNDVREKDNENVRHVVDNKEISSETNKEELTSNNGERRIEDATTALTVQQSMDDPTAAASLLLEANKNVKHSKSQRKSKKKDGHSRRSKTDSRSRNSSCLKDDLFSDRLDYRAALQRDVEREPGSSENLSGNVSAYDIVDENRSRKASATVTSSSSKFELGHSFYDETVVEVKPISVNTNDGDNDLGAHNCDRSASEDFVGHNSLGVRVLSNVHVSHLDSNSYTEQNSNYAKFYEAEHHTQIQFVDDNDNDQPIDYSMRSFVSPAAALRTGFTGNGFLPYPARYYMDHQQRTTRSDLYHTVAEIPSQTFVGQPVSHYSNRADPHLAGVTNGVVEHTSGTFVEMVDASSQTDVESKVDSSEDKSHGLSVEYEFLLKIFIQFTNTVAAMAQSGTLNYVSPGCISQPQFQNVTAISENRSNPRLDGVSCHEERQVANIIPNGIHQKNVKKKKKKGIPQKRSQRILDLEARKEKENAPQNTNETEVVTPKMSKRNADQEFEVENVVNSYFQLETDDNWSNSCRRRISFESNLYVLMETPKRPSKYVRRK